MVDLIRGKQIFDNLIEYPLRPGPGVKDYVFFAVTTGYGKYARRFFDRFYPNHTKSAIRSLEDLINILHTEVTQRNVTHIREIVIVSHGNAQGLMLPVVNGATETNLPHYLHVWSFSLACLQQDMLEAKHTAFADKRRTVIARLQNDSWVTIRACLFGGSRDGMYGLYSFFGGRANVYAPTVYQFFGTMPIAKGHRLNSRLRVHEHLVKQRFLPKDVHTRDRRDAIVNTSIDRAWFSEPFSLAAKPVLGAASEAAVVYDDLVGRLNAGGTNDLLKARFLEHDFVLTPRARGRVVTRNTAWKIVDTITHEGVAFRVRYQVYEAIAPSGASGALTATLWAEAHLEDVPGGEASIPIQLFFTEKENAAWQGRRFTLAYYTDEPGDNPARKAEFDAVLAVLTPIGVSDAPVPPGISAAFKARLDIALSGQARIRRISSSGAEPIKRITWAIRDAVSFAIKLEHPASSGGSGAHAITAYDSPDEKTRLRRERQLVSTLGSDPDTPGTELAAYLDRHTREDLAALIEYCRTPFKPGRSLHIHHAQEALRRTKGYVKWLFDHVDFANVPLPADPYSSLSYWEQEDSKVVSYQFNFGDFWSEVKASNPSTTAIQSDLFADESLGKKFRIEDAVVNRTALINDEFDSPFTDADRLRTIEMEGKERFFAAEKFVFDVPEEDDLDCRDFNTFVASWAEVEHLEPAEIKRILEARKTPSGKSMFEILESLKDSYSFLKNMAKLAELVSLPTLPLDYKDMAKLAVKRVPFLSRIAWLQAIAEAEFAVTIPLALMMRVLEDQQDAMAKAEFVGRVTATRQWLRALQLLTFREDDFPDDFSAIDITTSTSAEPYYISRYHDEQVLGRRGVMISPHPEQLKAGFDKGVSAMPAVGIELRRNATLSVDEGLRELGLDSCKVAALTRAGMLNYKKLEALVIRRWVDRLLDQLPTL